MFPGIHEIARRYPDVHLAVVHLGGHCPRGERVAVNAQGVLQAL
ncbi:hypothetical protein D3C57_150030 [Streptomyces rapamycinicus NRRL 5491]|uniref:Uncharacterized protein n=2 Tax=Streptomyces rapamycinicus TaxID=1226757 RepID=A0A3L8QZZ4_STRRN|nr:hypothetical protein D3C57_150030 [Streptomyces rapamycinicus NRRL 5491]